MANAKQHHICIAESSPCLQSVLSSALAPAQYKLITAQNAVDCINVVSDMDIIFVDLVLEDMDGLSLIEELRTAHRLAQIQSNSARKQVGNGDVTNTAAFNAGTPSIVAFLARGALEKVDLSVDEIRQMAIQSGADAVFVAPFNLGELMSTIARFCELKTAAA